MRETLLAPTKAELEQAAKEWEKNLPPGAVIHEGWAQAAAFQEAIWKRPGLLDSPAINYAGAVEVALLQVL